MCHSVILSWTIAATNTQNTGFSSLDNYMDLGEFVGTTGSSEVLARTHVKE